MEPKTEMPQCCTDTLENEGASCLFGCGTTIHDDGMCPACRDHSANRFECECGKSWEEWDGWQEAE